MKLIADKAGSGVSKEEGLHASALVSHFNSIKCHHHHHNPSWLSAESCTHLPKIRLFLGGLGLFRLASGQSGDTDLNGATKELGGVIRTIMHIVPKSLEKRWSH